MNLEFGRMFKTKIYRWEAVTPVSKLHISQPREEK